LLPSWLLHALPSCNKKKSPRPIQAFCALAKEMWPGNFAPTPAHCFIKLLAAKGVLKRCFTQNIDTLEREVGVDPELLVEAHGSFGEAHCVECHASHEHAWIKGEIMAGRVPRCPACGDGLVKPDIVFFGEGLPTKFFDCRMADVPAADLVLVMGTSLTVRACVRVCVCLCCVCMSACLYVSVCE